jgi:hypothetical protein
MPQPIPDVNLDQTREPHLEGHGFSRANKKPRRRRFRSAEGWSAGAAGTTELLSFDLSRAFLVARWSCLLACIPGFRDRNHLRILCLPVSALELNIYT